ncbi:hypothetical protein [Deinococcus arenicola]|uniref:Tetratricopeptide repeat protein n=1 Tax=Deinococcus arenicola TaxID=2994950 RepID=A0ABU4DTY6_9DEIO|nr:hypothetical protein [Deinococcus sp. ZS9-10]MDV6375442.1 hypothetical protein [Deinococcus sp. ZS9-10]
MPNLLNPLKKILLTALLLIPTGLAAPVDDALAALLKGQPDVSVKLLAGRQDAPSLALLARAYVGQTTFVADTPTKKKLYAASERAARAAIAADPRNAEGYVELANALALQLQGAGVVQATRSGLEIKGLFEQALKLDPTQARAWMGLGVWHAQALGLGPLVKLATGASEQTMRADHQKSIDLELNEVFFRLNYADSLLLLAKSDAGRAAALTGEARALLSAALTLTPQTYWQRYDQSQVRGRLNSLK